MIGNTDQKKSVFGDFLRSYMQTNNYLHDVTLVPLSQITLVLGWSGLVKLSLTIKKTYSASKLRLRPLAIHLRYFQQDQKQYFPRKNILRLCIFVALGDNGFVYL